MFAFLLQPESLFLNDSQQIASLVTFTLLLCTHPLGQRWVVVLGVKQVLVFLKLSAELGCVRSVFQTAVCCCWCQRKQKRMLKKTADQFNKAQTEPALWRQLNICPYVHTETLVCLNM